MFHARNTSNTSKKYAKATTKCKNAFFLTGNTVPMLGHSICLQYRPHCSRPGDGTQRSHSGEKTESFSPVLAPNTKPHHPPRLKIKHLILLSPHSLHMYTGTLKDLSSSLYTSTSASSSPPDVKADSQQKDVSELTDCYCSHSAAMMCLLFVSAAEK